MGRGSRNRVASISGTWDAAPIAPAECRPADAAKRSRNLTARTATPSAWVRSPTAALSFHRLFDPINVLLFLVDEAQAATPRSVDWSGSRWCWPPRPGSAEPLAPPTSPSGTSPSPTTRQRRRHPPAHPGITDVNRLMGLTRSGEAFELAVNRFNDSELAGACFSPDGKTRS